ncbi:MAG: hypothetical protein KY442_06525, partial [Proteobacteria bacterium]|nr:hypothetical protein [Pseudomonadota bacterium]
EYRQIVRALAAGQGEVAAQALLDHVMKCRKRTVGPGEDPAPSLNAAPAATKKLPDAPRAN